MKFVKKITISCCLILLFSSHTYADNLVFKTPDEIKTEMNRVYLIGSDILRFLGFRIYDVALFSEKNKFSYQNKFAININYKKSFDRQSLTDRSIDEIERNYDLKDSEISFYKKELNRIFSDVKNGDSKTALYLPNQGVKMFYNGRLNGIITDKKLARRFIDIWIHENSSYPDIARKLIGKSDER